MNQQPEKKTSSPMPRGAIITVIIGLIVTLGVIAVDLRKGGGTAVEIEWDTVEVVETPKAEKLGSNGSFGLARTSIAALAPIESGDLLFRIAGVVSVDSGGRAKPTRVRCDITSPAEGSRIAQTPGARAAWPRPSDELQAQEVPEASVAVFKARGADALFLPIRDVFRQFTDSAAVTSVDWDEYEEQNQSLIWDMPEGTGPGAATLGYSVIFKTLEQPLAEIRCSGSVGNSEAKVEAKAVQQEWPLEAPETEEVDPDSAPVEDSTAEAPVAE